MKNKYVFVAVMLVCILVASMGLTTIYVNNTQSNEAKIDNDEVKIVTSFYPMYVATENIIAGIDGVSLTNLSEPQTGCLHDFQMTPADMKLLSTADVFVINGGGIEGFMSDVAGSYPELEIVEACQDISLLGESENDAQHEEAHVEVESHAHDEARHEESHVEEESHAHDDAQHEEVHVEEESHAHDEVHAHDHGGENAHAWMSVKLYRSQVATIASRLAEIDPDNSEAYLQNAREYDQKLEKLQEKQEEIMELAAGKNIIIFHEAYEYVASDYGMNVSYTMDLDEERQVSAGEVAEVIDEIRQNNVSVILAEELYGKNMGDAVIKEADVQVIYIDTLNRGNYGADSYITGMTNNIELIKTAFNK